MANRWRYLVNVDSGEIHDLEQEDAAGNGCQIGEIQEARLFRTLREAWKVGKSPCEKCKPGRLGLL